MGEGARGKGSVNGQTKRGGPATNDSDDVEAERPGGKRNWCEPIAALAVDARVLTQAVRDT